MTDYLDFFNIYIMGIAQMLTGFYIFTGFLKKRVRKIYYFLFTAVGIAVITVVPSGGIEEFLAYLLMLAAAGIFICNADKALVVLYAVLTVEIMQLCYGISNSALSILYVLPNVYPLMLSFSPHMAGIGFMVSGNMALLAAVFCYRTADRYFLYNETIKRQYVLMILTPVLMMFLISGYIRSVIYGNTISTDGRGIKTDTNHYQMLMIQLLAMASLFCIMSAYKKLLENFRLSTELSLLEQEEHFLNQYVEEARDRYEKTKSFRHDIRNHITVIKELLQRKEPEQAFLYIEDMEGMAEELSFSCSTNNPAADVLIGNKLGIAEGMGIDVCCSVSLPYPCSIRDIDFCIILSNALDNAIHACKRMDHKDEKYIHVTGRIQGDFILLEVENSFRGSDSFRKGTGLSNIEAVAEKYHGTMDIKIQGAAVVLSVLLIIPQHSESISQQMGECSVSDSRNR